LPPAVRISDFSLSTVKQGVVWSGSTTGTDLQHDGWRQDLEQRHELYRPAVERQLRYRGSGHNDVNTAYVLANLGFGRGGGAAGSEQHYIYRTHDGGKTWTRIVNGLPTDERTGSQVHVIREDPNRKACSFAGTETTVYVSFDDGDHWQSLRLNLPSTSIRDMVFHTDHNMNDLVICTYGRGFWVLDDMSPLRDDRGKGQQIARRRRTSSNRVTRFARAPTLTGISRLTRAAARPKSAVRRAHLLPPEQETSGEIKLQIFDSANKLVRTITSTLPPMYDRPPYPDYWLMPAAERALSTTRRYESHQLGSSL
jgi:hypothetical protein